MCLPRTRKAITSPCACQAAREPAAWRESLSDSKSLLDCFRHEADPDGPWPSGPGANPLYLTEGSVRGLDATGSRPGPNWMTTSARSTMCSAAGSARGTAGRWALAEPADGTRSIQSLDSEDDGPPHAGQRDAAQTFYAPPLERSCPDSYWAPLDTELQSRRTPCYAALSGNPDTAPSQRSQAPGIGWHPGSRVRASDPQLCWLTWHLRRQPPLSHHRESCTQRVLEGPTNLQIFRDNKLCSSLAKLPTATVEEELEHQTALKFLTPATLTCTVTPPSCVDVVSTSFATSLANPPVFFSCWCCLPVRPHTFLCHWLSLHPRQLPAPTDRHAPQRPGPNLPIMPTCP
jgi:hypothetical protein